MLSLRTLGGLYVANEDGEPIAGAVTQRRVLALLAVLAVAGDRGVTRDKLLAMVVQHWVLVAACWRYADRSLVKAAQVVRDHAVGLASARARLDRLTEVLETIQQILTRTARMNSRKKHPNTYQLLLALTAEPSQA